MNGVVGLTALLLLLLGNAQGKMAKCDIKSIKQGVQISGRVDMEQKDEKSKVMIKTVLRGLTVKDTEHGMHVLEATSCDAAKVRASKHFDENGKRHGFVNNGGIDHHGGDLGNVWMGKGPLVIAVNSLEVDPKLMGLFNKKKVIGKALVIRQTKDGFTNSAFGGDAVGCCIITNGATGLTAARVGKLSTMMLATLSLFITALQGLMA